MRRAALLLLAAVLASGLASCSSIQIDRPLLPAAPTTAPAAPLAEVWERDVDGAFGPSAPLVGNGMVVVGTRKGEAVVLDAATGGRMGRVSLGNSIDGALVASPDGQTLYVPVSRGRSGVVAYRLREGREVWAWRADSMGHAVDAGLALVGSTLVAAAHDGLVFGLDAATGSERWRRHAPVGVQNHAAPVVLSDGLVAIADDRGRVEALDASNGGVRWTAEVGASVYAAPAVAGGLLLVPTTHGVVVALDAATGAERWRRTLGTTGRERLTTPSVAGPTAVLGITDGRVVALDAATGATAWAWTGTGAIVGAPLLSGGTVYVGTMDRRLVALDAATGAETWSTELRGRVKSAFAVLDGRLVVLHEPRHVSLYGAPAPTVGAVAARP